MKLVTMILYILKFFFSGLFLISHQQKMNAVNVFVIEYIQPTQDLNIFRFWHSTINSVKVSLSHS